MTPIIIPNTPRMIISGIKSMNKVVTSEVMLAMSVASAEPAAVTKVTITTRAAMNLVNDLGVFMRMFDRYQRLSRYPILTYTRQRSILWNRISNYGLSCLLCWRRCLPWVSHGVIGWVATRRSRGYGILSLSYDYQKTNNLIEKFLIWKVDLKGRVDGVFCAGDVRLFCRSANIIIPSKYEIRWINIRIADALANGIKGFDLNELKGAKGKGANVKWCLDVQAIHNNRNAGSNVNARRNPIRGS